MEEDNEFSPLFQVQASSHGMTISPESAGSVKSHSALVRPRRIIQLASSSKEDEEVDQDSPSDVHLDCPMEEDNEFSPLFQVQASSHGMTLSPESAGSVKSHSALVRPRRIIQLASSSKEDEEVDQDSPSDSGGTDSSMETDEDIMEKMSLNRFVRILEQNDEAARELAFNGRLDGQPVSLDLNEYLVNCSNLNYTFDVDSMIILANDIPLACDLVVKNTQTWSSAITRNNHIHVPDPNNANQEIALHKIPNFLFGTASLNSFLLIRLFFPRLVHVNENGSFRHSLTPNRFTAFFDGIFLESAKAVLPPAILHDLPVSHSVGLENCRQPNGNFNPSTHLIPRCFIQRMVDEMNRRSRGTDLEFIVVLDIKKTKAIGKIHLDKPMESFQRLLSRVASGIDFSRVDHLSAWVDIGMEIHPSLNDILVWPKCVGQEYLAASPMCAKRAFYRWNTFTTMGGHTGEMNPAFKPVRYVQLYSKDKTLFESYSGGISQVKFPDFLKPDSNGYQTRLGTLQTGRELAQNIPRAARLEWRVGIVAQVIKEVLCGNHKSFLEHLHLYSLPSLLVSRFSIAMSKVMERARHQILRWPIYHEQLVAMEFIRFIFQSLALGRYVWCYSWKLITCSERRLAFHGWVVSGKFKFRRNSLTSKVNISETLVSTMTTKYKIKEKTTKVPPSMLVYPEISRMLALRQSFKHVSPEKIMLLFQADIWKKFPKKKQGSYKKRRFPRAGIAFRIDVVDYYSHMRFVKEKDDPHLWDDLFDMYFPELDALPLKIKKGCWSEMTNGYLAAYHRWLIDRGRDARFDLKPIFNWYNLLPTCRKYDSALFSMRDGAVCYVKKPQVQRIPFAKSKYSISITRKMNADPITELFEQFVHETLLALPKDEYYLKQKVKEKRRIFPYRMNDAFIESHLQNYAFRHVEPEVWRQRFDLFFPEAEVTLEKPKSGWAKLQRGYLQRYFELMNLMTLQEAELRLALYAKFQELTFLPSGTHTQNVWVTGTDEKGERKVYLIRRAV